MTTMKSCSLDLIFSKKLPKNCVSLTLICYFFVLETFEMRIQKSIENQKSRSSGKVGTTHADWPFTASSKWLDSNLKNVFFFFEFFFMILWPENFSPILNSQRPEIFLEIFRFNEKWRKFRFAKFIVIGRLMKQLRAGIHEPWRYVY